MPQRSQLRRRQTAKATGANQQPHQADPTPSSASPETRSKLQSLKPYLLQVGRVLHTGLLGLLCAASLTRNDAAVFLFVSSIGAFLFVLLLTFMSILRAPDRTPVPLPAVHHADGTVTRPDPITIHDHDKKIASYFSTEWTCFGIAAAWLYVWVSFRPIFLIFSLYLAYRIYYHPLFRIHIWKEPHCPEFERPFGGVPLFREGDATSPVKVVAGNAAFQRALSAAGEKLVVVDFSAVWCAPCRAIAPVFKEIAAERQEDCVFLTVDVDTSQDIATRESISSIPTFIFFKSGERMEMMRGATPQKLRDAIQRHR